MRKTMILLITIVFCLWLVLATTEIFHVYIIGDVSPRIGPVESKVCIVNSKCVDIPLWVAYKLMFLGARTDVLDISAFPQ